MATAHDFKLPFKSEEVLKEFVKLAWGVTIPDVQVCPHHTTPWRAFADAYFAKNPMAVWFASRGFGGKSFLLSVLSNTEAATLGASVSVLGGSGAQSKRVMEHMNGLWHYKNAPRGLLVGEAATTTRLVNGAVIEALMASQASVRGGHPQKLHLDEIDEMDITILDASMGQTMKKGTIEAGTILSSTRQYANGTMQTVLERASERGYPVYSWCYKENLEPHGWLTNSEVARKKLEVTKTMWDTEYENQEPSPGSRAIQPDAVEKMFDKRLGIFDGTPGQYIEIEPPLPGAHYSNGADWAKKNDWTVIATIRDDLIPKRVVAWERIGRLDWPVMVAKLDARIKRYGGKAMHDGTGLGDVVKDYMTEAAIAFIMAGRQRADLLSEYIAACENQELVYPFIRSAYTEHKFASQEDVFGGEGGGHLPDSISAGALMWRASGHGEGSGFALGYKPKKARR